ncbi:MAG: ATP-binding protein, partial [Alphaproteobacteria bacterium]
LTQQTIENNLPLSFYDLVEEAGCKEAKLIIDKALNGDLPSENVVLNCKLNNAADIVISVYFNRIDHNGKMQLIIQCIDITEQKNLEMRFAHSQKMQAVGQLAGGVAHDFNNLLTAMIGFCDLLLMRHPPGDQSFADIMQIKQNANRAANLVRQLLAFSRRQTLQPKTLDITDVLAELSNLVRRLIGENIELKMVHGRDLSAVRADQGQLEQVLINLAVNARDAMPDGGNLLIQTSKATISASAPLPPELIAPAEEDQSIPPGDYVLVEVTDTGCGIPRSIIEKIFEPFFSTKPVGSGTGLGLSTVYGIIKQTGGYLYVKSIESDGTTFSIYFPAVSQEERIAETATAEAAEKITSMDLTGKSMILLVEDETPVRIFAARALGNKGYTVLEADCAETALEIMKNRGKEIEIIITDVIMPGMNGPTMIEQVMPNFPEIKVIFISGYAEDVFVNNFGAERSFNFLAKPFTLKQLASKVKEVLGK